MAVTLLVSLPSLFIDDSFLSYDDSLSSDSFDTSSDSSSSALSSSPYKLTLSSSSFINSSLSLYAGGGIKSAKSVYTSTAGNGTTASNIWSFSPIGVVDSSTDSASTGSSQTSNSKTTTNTNIGQVIFSGYRSTGYEVSDGTTYSKLTIYGSTTVGATSGSSNVSELGNGSTSSSTDYWATTGYSFGSEAAAEAFGAALKTAVNKSSSNYFYSELAKANFYYIDRYTIYSDWYDYTHYIPYASGSSFSYGGISTTTYSTFQQKKDKN